VSAAVVVTGTSVLCGLGREPRAVWRAALEGRRGHFRRAAGAEYLPPSSRVPAFEPRTFLDRRRARFLTREAALGFVAAQRALADAGCPGLQPSLQWGCFVGAPANFGDPDDFVDAFEASIDDRGRFRVERFGRTGAALVHPFGLIRALANGVLCSISIEHAFRGLNLNFCSGGTSSALALAAALRALRSGRIRRALVVGYDGLSSALALIRSGLGAEPDGRDVRASIGARRDVLYPGEAAAAAVLESLGDARRRGARADVELAAVGAGRDSREGSRADQGLGAALREALERSETDAGSLGWVHTDACGGRLHWQRLDRALHGAGCRPGTAVSSTTFVTGCVPAASTALGVFFAAQAIRTGRVPPTAGLPRRTPRFCYTLPARPQRRVLDAVAVLAADVTGEASAVVLRHRSERKAGR
jgi:3-oxoacyl-[acyl-carrier-protein] synthase II